MPVYLIWRKKYFSCFFLKFHILGLSNLERSQAILHIYSGRIGTVWNFFFGQVQLIFSLEHTTRCAMEKEVLFRQYLWVIWHVIFVFLWVFIFTTVSQVPRGEHFLLSGPHLPTKLKWPKYCTVRLLYAVFIFLRNALTAGHRKQTINNFSSERFRDGSLTAQIWFPTSKYSVEVKKIEFILPPPRLCCQHYMSELRHF